MCRCAYVYVGKSKPPVVHKGQQGMLGQHDQAGEVGLC